MLEPIKVRGVQVDSPGIRNCCLLSDGAERSFASGGWADRLLGEWLDFGTLDKTHVLGSSGFPHSSDDTTGLFYTCRGGVIDLGHLRDLCDATRYYFIGLMMNAEKDSKFPGNGGSIVTIDIDVSEIFAEINNALQVARYVAYYESVAYEIFTYHEIWPGKRHSSFSPEDLVSNYIGTYVAYDALKDRGDNTIGAMDEAAYNKAVTESIDRVVKRLGPLNKADSLAAFRSVKGRWLKEKRLVGISDTAVALAHGVNPDLLQRRNFNIDPILPWLIPRVAGCADTAFPESIPRSIPSWTRETVQVWYKIPEGVLEADSWKDKTKKFLHVQDIPREVSRVKALAKKKYGAEFDQP